MPGRRHDPRTRRRVLAALAAGGTAGALLRYLAESLLPAASGHFPTMTFLVNVSGSLVLAVLLVVFDEQQLGGRTVRLFLTTGLIGAYTTFSTLAVESVLLGDAGHVVVAGVYVLASVAAGLVAAAAATAVARRVFTQRRRRRRAAA